MLLASNALGWSGTNGVALVQFLGQGVGLLGFDFSVGVERVALRNAVEDTGQGISPDKLGKLFIPFFTTKTKGHSIGIGLSICYNIIQQHGGEILVCSEPGKGSIFKVMLPTGFPGNNKEQNT